MSDIRHEYIAARMDHLQDTGAIESFRYERASQRYLVTLSESMEVAGGAEETDTLILTLMSAESFLSGAAVGARLVPAERVFVVDEEGGVYVQ
jgi:hypothetical protein